MYDYLIGAIFIVGYILFLYMVGSCFFKKENNFSSRLIYGYLLYSFIIALGGLPIQFANLSWVIFKYYLIVICIIFIAIIMFQYTKEKKTWKEDFFLLKNSVFPFIIAGFITIVSFLFISNIWAGNSTDDGYYLSKIGSLPYNINSFYTNPATGLPSDLGRMGSYLFNVYEMELSVYVNILKISPIIFSKVFVAFFNYFLFSNCVIAVSNKILGISNLKQEKKDKIYAITKYSCVIICFFMFSSLFLESKHLLVLQDTWQFNSAMYFGSSVVRTMGMFMLILPFIDKDKLTYKDVITVIVIAVALISKSSIAIPLIFLAAFSYLLSYLFFADKKRRILSIVLALLTLLVSVVLKDNLSIQNVIYSFINKNNASIIIYLSIVSILTSFFVFKNKKIYRFNITLILIFFLIILNPINNIFELFSIYSFVGARALTTYVYTLITVGFIYLIFYIGFITKKIIRRILLSTITIISATGTIYSVSKENEVKIIDRIKILYNSPSVYPNSSIQLGKALEEVYEENGEILNVMTFEGVMLNNMPHFLGAMLRNVSPHSISLSGIGRYGQTPTGDFVGFTAGHQKYFDEFIINPNEETTYALLNLTNEYPINCFVVASDKYDYYFNTMGFELVKETFDSYTGFKYFVYYKGE